MRRFWIVLLIAAVAIVLAVPVSAAPPLCSDKPYHPQCIPDDPGAPPAEDPPLGGETCYALGDWGSVPVSGDFTITLGGEYPDSYCIDVMSVPGNWEITVTTGGEGKVISGSLFLRDSFAPGDGCVCVLLDDDSLSCDHCGYIFRSNNLPGEPVIFYDTPGTTVNSCGTEFAEYVGSYWEDTDGDGVEEFFQGAFVEEQTIEASPLAFLPSMKGTGGATVTLTIDLPGVGNSDPYDVTPTP